MDGVSGAASVIAVASIALQSTKVIYEAVTGIKNGPSQVQDLASALRNLQQVLQRIAGLSRDQTQAQLTELKKFAETCAKDVQSIEIRLSKLSGGGKVEKAWKMVKTYLQTKDLEVIRTTVQLHVQLLSSEMGIATM